MTRGSGGFLNFWDCCLNAYLKMAIIFLDEDDMQAMWVLGSYIPRALLPSYIFEHCILHAYMKMAIIVLDEDDTRARWVGGSYIPRALLSSYIFEIVASMHI